MTPAPLSGMFCGLLAALSLTLMLALRAPVALGVKVTLSVHCAPAPSVFGLIGQVLVSAKSAALVPVNENPLIVNALVPELVRVMLRAALVVPTFWLLKLRAPGLTVTVGTEPATMRFKMFAVMIWLIVFAKPRAQSQKPSLNPLSTPQDH